MDRWAVCKNRNPGADGEEGYELRRLFSYERCVAGVDPDGGGPLTLIMRDGQVVDSAGELCGEFEDRWEAKMLVAHLERIRKIMEA